MVGFCWVDLLHGDCPLDRPNIQESMTQRLFRSLYRAPNKSKAV